MDVDEVEAHLLVAAIRQWRGGAAAMAHLRRARVPVTRAKTERARSRKRGEVRGSERGVRGRSLSSSDCPRSLEGLARELRVHGARSGSEQ